MSDLEEENRIRSRSIRTSEWNEDQFGMLLNCKSEKLSQAKKLYEAIPIPGELNTRVRAAIESDQRRRRHQLVWSLIGAGAAVFFGVCCVIAQAGGLSKQREEFSEPPKNMTAYPETQEENSILQTIFTQETTSDSEEIEILESKDGFE